MAFVIGGAIGVFYGGFSYAWTKHGGGAPAWIKSVVAWSANAFEIFWRGLSALLWASLAMVAAFSLALTGLPGLDPALQAAGEVLQSISLALHNDLFPPLAVLAWGVAALGCALNLQTSRWAFALGLTSYGGWHLVGLALERLWAL